MTETNDIQEFNNAFELEELEERLEFRDWYAEAGCETDFNGNNECGGTVGVRI